MNNNEVNQKELYCKTVESSDNKVVILINEPIIVLLGTINSKLLVINRKISLIHKDKP